MKKLTAVFALTLFLAACHHSKTSTMCYDDTCAAETGEIVYIVTNNTPVLFAFDSTEINAHFNSQLDQIAQMALQNDSTEVLIKGYTDDVGGNSYNFALSARRANAVANALMKRGVPAEKITISGYGENQPAASNQTEEGRHDNRRVETDFLVK